MYENLIYLPLSFRLIVLFEIWNPYQYGCTFYPAGLCPVIARNEVWKSVVRVKRKFLFHHTLTPDSKNQYVSPSRHLYAPMECHAMMSFE